MLVSFMRGSALIDLATGEVKRYPIGSAFSSGLPALIRGNNLIANNDKKLCVIDLASGKVVREWTGKPFDQKWGYLTNELSASDDGRVVAFSNGERVTPPERGRIWVVNFGEKVSVTEFETPQGNRPMVAVSPDGKVIAAGYGCILDENPKAFGIDAELPRTIFWDVATKKEIARLQTGGSWARFSHDGTRLLIVSTNNAAEVWDWKNQKLVCNLKVEEDRKERGWHDWLFSRDGATIAGCFMSGEVRVWDAKTGDLLKTYPPPKFPDQVRQFALVELSGQGIGWTPDGKLLGMGYWGESAVVWDVLAGRFITPLTGFPESIASLVFTPDGKSLYVGSYSRLPIWRWDLTDTPVVKEVSFVAKPVNFTAGIHSEYRAFSPDAKLVALADGSYGLAKSVVVYSTAGGSERYQAEPLKELHLYGDTPHPTYSPDSKWIAFGGQYDATPKDGYAPMCVLDASTGKVREGIQLKGGGRTGCAFSPDSERLVVARFIGPTKPREKGSMHIAAWDLTRDKPLASGPMPEWVKSTHIAVAPDNQTVLMIRVTGAGTVELVGWDMTTGKTTLERASPVSRFTAPIVVAHRRGLVAAAGYDVDENPIVCVGAWPDLKDFKVFRGHSAEISALAFSLDGKTLASGSWDSTVLLWDVSDIEP
jgi:WD40 repeat protein